MKTLETIQEFYESRHKWIPPDLRSGLGHFNVFSLTPYIGKGKESIAYGRREWYNITLAHGQGRLNYADKTYDIKKNAIVFNNPQTPFSWEKRDLITGGYYCIFNRLFLNRENSILNYSLFQPGHIPLFELTDREASIVDAYFRRLIKELKSGYEYKYEIAKIVIAEMVHFTMKLESYKSQAPKYHNNSEQTVMRFMELLEHQFPIEDLYQTIHLRSSSDFASKLNIHTNHLNRLVKKVTQKTTTQVIAERILQEGKLLLRHTAWNVSEIAFSLGFSETSHFNNFFKKHTKLTPLEFRNV